MRVAVTGGTGFVGSHAVAAMVNAGHDVRLLVRDPARAANIAALGVEQPSDLVVGDVTDPEAVTRLLEGREGVVHAASVFSLDARRAKDVARTNVASTELVLGEAARRNLERIVHVSSVAALLPAWNQIVSGESPIGAGVDAYTRSKGGSEAVARRLREQGAPVVCIMPAAVTGPIDPYLGEINWQLMQVLRGVLPVVPRSTWLPLMDVRDLANAIVHGLEEAPPGSYTLCSLQEPVQDVVRRLAGATGRRLPAVGVPNAVARASADLADRVQPFLPWSLPLRGGSVRELTNMPHVDSTAAREHLGYAPRPPEETIDDTVRWLCAAGHISRKQAGRLAPEPTMAT